MAAFEFMPALSPVTSTAMDFTMSGTEEAIHRRRAVLHLAPICFVLYPLYREAAFHGLLTNLCCFVGFAVSIERI